MMSCLKRHCNSCCPCCCPPLEKSDKYPHIEYKTPEHANVAVRSAEIQKVPLEKIFEFQQPKPEYGIHPQMTTAPATSPVVSDQPRVVHRTTPDREASESTSGSIPSLDTYPTLQFSLYYDIQRRTLTVHLQQAYNLPQKGRHTHCDPFAVMFLLPNKEEIFESQIIPKTLNPVFDQMFEFTSLLPQEIRRQTLIIRMYDHDRFTKNDLVGVVALSLEEADLYGMTVRMRIDEKVEHLRMETKGDLLFSLSYVSQTELLQGIILKATNLQKQNISGTAGTMPVHDSRRLNPFVKVYLMYQGKKQAKWKSTVKKHTLIPIFNEAFQFNISHMEITDISLEIVMMEYDRFSKDEIVGVVHVGWNVDDEVGRLHWEEVTTAPGHPVSRWHNIKPLVPDDYGSERSGSTN